jgi:hypothetical protein
MRSKRSLTRYRGEQCLNCDHPLDISDKFCPFCGQLNTTKKLSFKDFIEEFLAGMFAYDSRLRLTIRTMTFHPGRITKDYIRGKRIRYANPYRFYLSTSIVFFIIWSFSNTFDDFYDLRDNTSITKVKELTDKEIKEVEEATKEIPVPNKIDSLVSSQMKLTKVSYKEFYKTQHQLDDMSLMNSLVAQFDLYHRYQKQTGVTNPMMALDELEHSHTFFNHWMYKKAMDFQAIKEEPEIMIEYVIGKLPFIIFFYLPVFALFIWLLYWRQPYNYMEHLIFTFNMQSAFFLVMSIAIILGNIFNSARFTEFALLVFLFYLYKALRNFYNQSRVKTIVKFTLLNGIFLILAIIAAISSLIGSFAIL